MKNVIMTAVLLGLSAAAVAADKPYVRAERASAVYRVGEEIVFQVQDPGTGATYTIDNGVNVTAPTPLTAEPIKVKAENPGFVLLSVHCGNDANKKPILTHAGAAIEPDKIVPGTSRPADFDTFWEQQLAQHQAQPLNIVRETPVPADKLPDGLVGFDVELRRGDITATGFLVLPSGAQAKSLPAIMTFLGASKVSAELPSAIWGAKRNALGFNLNFHGLANFLQRNAAAEAPGKKAVSKYQFTNADSRNDYAMRAIFLRTVMVADYLKQRPEFNGKQLVATGGSFGGCQALVCAALVPEVTLCISNATAMCDHMGRKAGHLPGWPNLLAKHPAAEENSAYFDVVNFAPRIKCPTHMAVGFIDTTCPPASSYAAYNALNVAEKSMSHSVTSGHGGRCLDSKDRSVFNFGSDAVKRHLAK